MVNYQPLWDILDARRIKKTELRNEAGLSSSTMAKLGKNEYVALSVLTRICKVLNCQIGDVCRIETGEEGIEPHEQ